MIIRLIIFLVINFGGLAIGGFFTGAGVPSEWYTELAKAPWTPPGWVFGAAWTTIMIMFSIYLMKLYDLIDRNSFLRLFSLQVVLNVGWNPVFFYYHKTIFGLLIISLLGLLIYYYLIKYIKVLKWWSIGILPYVVWITIAVSLNAYVVIYN
ncbi:TspO/MBR family protein [Flammeovirga agarivorans]|uniref:Tryptophan-rich sensory protein n=1 Tax=Flammeovirga agarivorans TaxID=2726742 RepID=A0A7X8SNW7_9BACT|nr:TspO/MBR family protein [Flammeovirga agarivorans]NLR93696.1 tryptophan-rich sensory protein [Flammeovirga agarivorans]